MIEESRRIIAQAIEGQKFALQFSGGKDSLACLQLLKPWWDQLIVLWNNMGDPFPETVAQMQRIRGLVKEFHEIKGNSRVFTQHQYPVDLLPMRATPVGRVIEPDGAKTTLISRFDCCWQNFWRPMTQFVQSQGITLLIRGQRDSESERAPIEADTKDPSGAGICLPLKAWSYEQVMDYLKSEGVELPRTYGYIKTSVDCMLCTAWLEDGRGRLQYLREFHPEQAREFERRLHLISAEVAHEVDTLKTSLQELT